MVVVYLLGSNSVCMHVFEPHTQGTKANSLQRPLNLFTLRLTEAQGSSSERTLNKGKICKHGHQAIWMCYPNEDGLETTLMQALLSNSRKLQLDCQIQEACHDESKTA